MTDYAAIAAMLHNGATYHQIITELSVAPASIAKTRKALGIPLAPGRAGRRNGTPDTDDQVAAMLRNGATYATIRAELHVSALRISAVRRTRQIPVPPGRRPGPTGVRTPEQTLAHYSQPTPDGHTHWTGPVDGGGKPMVWHRDKAFSGWRVAFRIHHGREPEGRVRITCDDPRCIAGHHLTDRHLRQTNQRSDAIFERIFGTPT